jgi:hypothetical protein
LETFDRNFVIKTKKPRAIDPTRQQQQEQPAPPQPQRRRREGLKRLLPQQQESSPEVVELTSEDDDDDGGGGIGRNDAHGTSAAGHTSRAQNLSSFTGNAAGGPCSGRTTAQASGGADGHIHGQIRAQAPRSVTGQVSNHLLTQAQEVVAGHTNNRTSAQPPVSVPRITNTRHDRIRTLGAGDVPSSVSGCAPATITIQRQGTKIMVVPREVIAAGLADEVVAEVEPRDYDIILDVEDVEPPDTIRDTTAADSSMWTRIHDQHKTPRNSVVGQGMCRARLNLGTILNEIGQNAAAKTLPPVDHSDDLNRARARTIASNILRSGTNADKAIGGNGSSTITIELIDVENGNPDSTRYDASGSGVELTRAVQRHASIDSFSSRELAVDSTNLEDAVENNGNASNAQEGRKSPPRFLFDKNSDGSVTLSISEVEDEVVAADDNPAVAPQQEETELGPQTRAQKYLRDIVTVDVANVEMNVGDGEDENDDQPESDPLAGL